MAKRKDPVEKVEAPAGNPAPEELVLTPPPSESVAGLSIGGTLEEEALSRIPTLDSPDPVGVISGWEGPHFDRLRTPSPDIDRDALGPPDDDEEPDPINDPAPVLDPTVVAGRTKLGPSVLLSTVFYADEVWLTFTPTDGTSMTDAKAAAERYLAAFKAEVESGSFTPVNGDGTPWEHGFSVEEIEGGYKIRGPRAPVDIDEASDSFVPAEGETN